MFMREKDFPTWKLGKLGELTGGGKGGGGLAIIISVGEEGVEINFCEVGGGVQRNFSHILPIFQPPIR